MGEGSGVRGSLPKRISNHRQNARQIHLNLFCRHPNESNTQRFDDFLAQRIGFALSLVNTAIYFDNKPFFRTVEINHKRADGILTPEFSPLKLSVAQSPPKNSFTRRMFFP